MERLSPQKYFRHRRRFSALSQEATENSENFAHQVKRSPKNQKHFKTFQALHSRIAELFSED